MPHEDKQFFDGFLLGAVVAGLILSSMIIAALYVKGREAGELVKPELLNQTMLGSTSQGFNEQDDQFTVLSKDEDKGRSLRITENGPEYQVHASLASLDVKTVIRLLANQQGGEGSALCYSADVTVYLTLWKQEGEQLDQVYSISDLISPDSWQVCLVLHGFAEESFYFTALTQQPTGRSQTLFIIDNSGHLEKGPTYSVVFAGEDGRISYPLLHIWSYNASAFAQIQHSEHDYSALKQIKSPLADVTLQRLLEAPDVLQINGSIQANLHNQQNRTHYETSITFDTAEGELRRLSW